MKKEEKSTPVSNKAKSIYKYELQATNQILRDALDVYPFSLHSTAQTNQYNTAHFQEYDQYLFDYNSPSKYEENQKKLNKDYLLKESFNFYDQNIFNSKRQFFQQKNFAKNSIFEEGIFKGKSQRYKKQLENDLDVNQGSLFYQFSSDNHEILLPNSCERETGNLFKSDKTQENKKEFRRQRKGLAQISLKVKNIVANKGRMSFKEVSDEVLKQTQEDLPTDIEQRQKQMKNIRRRVYDALNVLVSTGILGKEQKYVTHTNITNIPGKKLSIHWQAITQKNRQIEQQQNGYRDKQKNLKLLLKYYELTLLLHKRNEYNPYQQTKLQRKVQSTFNPEQDKIHFPFIFFVPPKNPQKLKVIIEYQERQKDCIKKIMVDGNQYLLTDLDILKYINFKQQLKRQDVQQIQNYILTLSLSLPVDSSEINCSLKKNKKDLSNDIYLED